MSAVNNSANIRLILTVSSILLLGIGAIFLVGVLERWVAATWMAYKFYGFSSEGFITLSERAAWTYIPAALVFSFLSYSNMLVSKRRQFKLAYILSKYAAIALLLAATLYAILGISPLNQWRP